MKQSNRAKEEYKYWNDIARSEDRNIHICDSDVTVKMCLDAIIPELGKPKSILEIGCGIGRLTIPVAKHFPRAKVHGVDISDEMLKIATRNVIAHGEIDNVSFGQVGDGRHLYLLNKVDAVYSMITFQHIDAEGVEEYIKEISFALKNDGIFRFQFVEGDEHSKFSQQYHLEQIVKWLEENDFVVKKVDKNLIYNSWIWITAKKI